MITDTSFIIDLLRGKSTALKKLEEIEKNKDSQIITTPTVFELVVGITMSSIPEKEKSKVIDILKNFSILPLLLEESWKAGEILGELFKQGTPIDIIDTQIAGIALCHNQTVITRNKKHFELVNKLKIESY